MLDVQTILAYAIQGAKREIEQLTAFEDFETVGKIARHITQMQDMLEDERSKSNVV